MQSIAVDLATRRAQYSQRLRALHLAEGYSYDDDAFNTRPYWPLQPVNKVRPHLWKWAEVRAAVAEAGELVGLGRGANNYDRRVIALTNPGLAGEYTLSGSLFGDIQFIKPGESAPCHRHTPSAARFIFEGHGGWTAVEGEKTSMRPGDVIFTGPWTWHDHGNDGQDDLLFLDVLDIPLLQYLAVSQWEFDYERVTGSADNCHHPIQASEVPDALHTQSGLVPRFDLSWKRNPAHLAVHRWEVVQDTLEKLRGEKGSAYDGVIVEFTHTANRGSVGPTMSIYTQMLRPGEKTMFHRHTSSTIYIGVGGGGRVTIDDRVFDWQPNDIFVVPSWSWHAHHNPGKTDAYLHSISDASLIAKLGFWREQRRLADGSVADTGWRGTPLQVE